MYFLKYAIPLACALALCATLPHGAGAAETTASSTSVPCQKEYLQPDGEPSSSAVPVDVAQAADDLNSAFALSREAAAQTGLTTTARRYWSGQLRNEAQVDINRNVAARTPSRKPQLSLYYWQGSSETLLQNTGASATTRSALELLGRPNARWTSQAAPRYSDRFLPIFAVGGWGGVIESARALSDQDRYSQYVLDVSLNGLLPVAVSFCLDNEGRISHYLSWSEDVEVEYRYVSPMIDLPDEDLWVPQSQLDLATDAASVRRKLKSVRSIIESDVAFATRKKIVESTRRWVGRLKGQWLIDPKWTETRSGTKVWFENPFNDQINGLKFIAIPDSLVRVVRYTSSAHQPKAQPRSSRSKSG